MQCFQSLFVVATDLTPTGNFKSCHCCCIVCVDVCCEVAVFVHFKFVGFVNSGVKGNCQFENVYCLLLFVNYHYIRFFSRDTEVGRNGAFGRCGESCDVAVDCVGFCVDEIDYVVKDVVLTPGVPTLLEEGVTTVEDVIGGVFVAAVGTKI